MADKKFKHWDTIEDIKFEQGHYLMHMSTRREGLDWASLYACAVYCDDANVIWFEWASGRGLPLEDFVSRVKADTLSAYHFRQIPVREFIPISQVLPIDPYNL